MRCQGRSTSSWVTPESIDQRELQTLSSWGGDNLTEIDPRAFASGDPKHNFANA
jgi:hypothetical protein